ncbi:hypothetical protein PSA01_19000 [Pseudonocardia saturnea]|uniref:Uncharacterized protein n=1 Tax=Pseudonocardia saturnea TaxID=33909 RepID=A0ABQ0RW65_9PSEU|nr:hypothetical protein Pdca_46600 [Pseudonocardia autotrophica]GEC24871.1 hypothetical protein PSA01_19000 [Pseudonocardia saturnea]
MDHGIGGCRGTVSRYETFCDLCLAVAPAAWICAAIVLASRSEKVTSASVKPRLAGRQPSSAVGCPG